MNIITNSPVFSFPMGSKKLYIAAFFIQLTFAGMSLMSKAAFAAGMNTYIFLFYRQVAGTLVLVPLTFLHKGKEKRPLSFKHLCQIFVISLIGLTLALDAYGMAINYTSATLGAAACNCVPVTTFLFAVLLRMEKVNLRKAAGIAKVVGIMVCILGAAILAFYKGPYLKPLFPHQLFHHSQSHHSSNSQKTWMIGCFFLLITSVSWGIWFVLQARFLKGFPHPMEFMCAQTVMSMVQSFVVAIVMERDPLHWKLGWDIRLFAVLYCGILVIGIANNGQCWVIREKGPVFQTMTIPLNSIATMIGSQLFLSEGIHLGSFQGLGFVISVSFSPFSPTLKLARLGFSHFRHFHALIFPFLAFSQTSIIGTFFLVMSLYSVLWGKSKELVGTTNPDSQPPPQEKEMKEPTSRIEVNSTIV